MKQTLALIMLALAAAAMALTPISIQHFLASRQAQEVSQPVWPIPEDETDARKARLINTLLPAIQQNNRDLLEKRARIERLQHQLQRGRDLGGRDLQWLRTLSERYRLDPPAQANADWLTALLRRIDIIPADLALAQGALESGWGESRFAIEANNYFGHWCFREGCGIVPAARPEGASHEVEKFPSVEESVRRYMHNLNSHPRYRQLRLIRARIRSEERRASGTEMAAGLDGYAQTGQAYVAQVRQMILSNGFDEFESY